MKTNSVKKNKKCKWLKTAAGKITIVLIISFFVLGTIGWFCVVPDKYSVKDFISSVAIGIATNLIGIIVTVTFVQHFIFRQEVREQKVKEAEKILRYNRVLELYFNKYVTYFNLVVTPCADVQNTNLSILKNDFQFKDLKDLHMTSLLEGDPFFGKTVINLFFDCEADIIEFYKRMIEDIDFEFFPEIYLNISTFLSAGIAINVRNGILDNEKAYSGEGSTRRKLTEDIAKDIAADDKYHWVETMSKPDRHANMMGPYVKLYQLLHIEGSLISKYRQEIEKINDFMKDNSGNA